MSYRFLVDAQKTHIQTLRLMVALLSLICLAMFYGWRSAPDKLTIHVPPDLRSGSTRMWWDIPPENVYAFGLYLFTQINRWPTNGEADMPRNLERLRHFLTPGCRQQLENEIRQRAASGELRNRIRGVYEIPGHGYADNPVLHVQQIDRDSWKVVLDIAADEYYQTAHTTEAVKRALVRYPIRILRQDVDAQMNPWGLVFDCYTEVPQRIEIEGGSK